VPDFLIRDIDAEVAERIKDLARERGWPLNETILHLIRRGLGVLEPEPPPEPGDISRLPGTLSDDESKALLDAMSAFKELPDDTPY
jgi:hypothetical protein